MEFKVDVTWDRVEMEGWLYKQNCSANRALYVCTLRWQELYDSTQQLNVFMYTLEVMKVKPVMYTSRVMNSALCNCRKVIKASN